MKISFSVLKIPLVNTHILLHTYIFSYKYEIKTQEIKDKNK